LALASAGNQGTAFSRADALAYAFGFKPLPMSKPGRRSLEQKRTDSKPMVLLCLAAQIKRLLKNPVERARIYPRWGLPEIFAQPAKPAIYS
jgi:hypothetical protein